jgi:F0F1-type ATP synthase membrane subunit c/vacuolar-type H+-ATPase subunit K
MRWLSRRAHGQATPLAAAQTLSASTVGRTSCTLSTRAPRSTASRAAATLAACLASGGAGFGAALLERNTSGADVISVARFALPAAP